MMLNAPRLRVIHVTTHIGIIDMVKRIEPGLVERTIRRGHDTLVKGGIEHPRIAVCGINPHAEENGLFGYGEEEEKVAPGIAAARELGVNVTVGLPVIRTSVDHGSAFDIAGTGRVEEASMVDALRQAADLAPTEADDH
jgi:4-hydroxy-L-threonine phosphate dehydrogenase PdxA